MKNKQPMEGGRRTCSFKILPLCATSAIANSTRDAVLRFLVAKVQRGDTWLSQRLLFLVAISSLNRCRADFRTSFQVQEQKAVGRTRLEQCRGGEKLSRCTRPAHSRTIFCINSVCTDQPHSKRRTRFGSDFALRCSTPKSFNFHHGIARLSNA